jgi:hypothetical protein
MSNVYQSQGDITLGDSTYENLLPNLSWTFTATGSGVVVSQTQRVTSGSWQPLEFTMSMNNGLYVTQIRNSSTGSIMIGGSTAGAGLQPIIPPGGWIQLAFAGTGTPLYAQAVTTNSSSIVRCSGIEK